ncbi:MAG TPA: hypothetical protein VFV62_07400 [Gaiellaceae bacterium]|nr:hypothetical protein [Gaiellaceae bacterium]
MKLERNVRRRRVTIGAVTAAVAAVLAGGIALAGVPGASGVINACYGDVSRLVRIVDAEAGEQCKGNEHALEWNQQGAKGERGPQGPPGETLVGYRTIKGAPEMEVTAVGWPAPGNPPTTVLTLQPPPGVYLVTASIAARKESGRGDLVCRVDGGKNEFASVFTRTALGAEPGHARRATVSGTGFTSLTTADPKLTLVCWQDENGAGEPAGENPTVFYANLNAVNVARATITIPPEFGPPIELP